MSYDIEIAGFNSRGIQVEAATAGITHMREIGFGHPAGYDGPDHAVTFYALPDPNFPGTDLRVANTNGDPVWEEEDSQAFADLAESCGVAL